MGQPFPGPWSFYRFPWLEEMHNSNAPMNIGQKSAQAGFSECLLNRVFYTIDVKAQSVLYVMPNKTPDAADFSSSRFNPALEESEYLRNLFSDTNNIGHKRAGSASLFIRGSRARAPLKSIPVSLIILDEVDEMTQENIPLAFQRSAGQVDKEAWLVSTPTINGAGINAYYQDSTQEHFHFQCPGCGRLTELTFPECLVVTADSIHDESIVNSYIKCKECNVKLPHTNKPEWLNIKPLWVPMYAGRTNRGFHINQMYSSTVDPIDIAKKAILAQTNEAEEQELYNSVLGLTHTTASSAVDDKHFTQCTKGYRQPDGLTVSDWSKFGNDTFGPQNNGKPSGLIITLGIDVGKYFHFEFDAWIRLPGSGRTSDPNENAYPLLLKADKVTNIEDLYVLIEFFRPNAIVIDAQPERRLSKNFCLRYPGRAKMCFYVEGATGRDYSEAPENNDQSVLDEPTVKVDRTSWLDLSQGRFKNGTIHLPQNLQGEYKENVKNLVRVVRKAKDSTVSYHYVHEKGKADHFAHARNYAEIAYPIACGTGSYGNIK